MKTNDLLREYKKLRLIHAGIQLLLTAILFLISKTLLQDLYLYKWTAEHLYLFVIPAILVATYLGKFKLSYTVCLWNISLVILGQILGDFIRNKNMDKISDITPAEEVYRLSHHYGFDIWFFGLILITLVAIILQVKKERKR